MCLMVQSNDVDGYRELTERVLVTLVERPTVVGYHTHYTEK